MHVVAFTRICSFEIPPVNTGVTQNHGAPPARYKNGAPLPQPILNTPPPEPRTLKRTNMTLKHQATYIVITNRILPLFVFGDVCLFVCMYVHVFRNKKSAEPI